MAIANRDVNLSNLTRIGILKGDLSASSNYFSDLLFEKLGTTRQSEVRGKIGDTKIPYKELVDNYINAL